MFLVKLLTNFGKDMTDKLRKKMQKTRILGSIFMPGKYVLIGYHPPSIRG